MAEAGRTWPARKYHDILTENTLHDQRVTQVLTRQLSVNQQRQGEKGQSRDAKSQVLGSTNLVENGQIQLIPVWCFSSPFSNEGCTEEANGVSTIQQMPTPNPQGTSIYQPLILHGRPRMRQEVPNSSCRPPQSPNLEEMDCHCRPLLL